MYTKSFRLGLNFKGGGGDRKVEAIGDEQQESPSLSSREPVSLGDCWAAGNGVGVDGFDR